MIVSMRFVVLCAIILNAISGGVNANQGALLNWTIAAFNLCFILILIFCATTPTEEQPK